MMSERIWLSWEIHRRNISLSRVMRAKLFQLEVNNNAFIKYPILIIKSFSLIKKENPAFVFVQNPSIVLAFFMIILQVINKSIKVIVDAHNVGIFFHHSNKFVQWLGQLINILIIRNAKLIIVTNSNLALYVKEQGGRPFVLPDPFPIFKNYQFINLKGKKNIFYICTFSSDEPYLEVFTAAEHLDKNIYIYVSGNYKKKNLPKKLPQNLILTGYIPDSEFVNYLYSADIIVDLTYREDCLVCGAYEAVAAEKPLILSNKVALKDYFAEGALYTDNTNLDIAAKINEAIEKVSLLKHKIQQLKRKRNEDLEARKEVFEGILSKLK